MQLIRRFRIPALLCALAVLLCELVSRPFVNMGICDDGTYILIAQKLAATGHIVYNGWATAMLGWQLYLGAAFIKLFGFSLTTVRMSTLLVAMALAFVLQRTLVRAGINELNATIGTLALVLSPLYLLLSVTFMTDIQGLFAIVLCLYGCLRALQTSTSRATIGWLCFAVATNAICGTSRQIAWLGILVMVPSTLWLLRAQRRVLFAGVAVTLAGAFFILACMLWFAHQPYSIPPPLLVKSFPMITTLFVFRNAFLDIPFLLLPIVVLFLPEIRKSRPYIIALICLGYIVVVVAFQHHFLQLFLMEPALSDWVNPYGMLNEGGISGKEPVFLNVGAAALLTIASIGGLIGLIASFFRSSGTPPAVNPPPVVSWRQLGVLLVPFTIAYVLLLVPPAAIYGISDRYLLALLLAALLCLVRYYQDRIHSRLPLAISLMVGLMAVYAITVTHNTFAFYRARVALAAELRSAGIADTTVNNGWEYNFDVELQHADFINDHRIVVPAHAYVPTPPLPTGTCPMYLYDNTPHIKPLYGVSFDPNACYGPTHFAPVHYSRWLASKPGTLYVVRYTAFAKP